MKKIHFDNPPKNKSTIFITISGLICVITGIFIEFQDDKGFLLIGLGNLLAAIGLGKVFWYKYFVQWNKKGIVIKINSIFGKSIPFTAIVATELNGDTLIIKKKYNQEMKFNLTGFQESDINELYDIILQHTEGKPQAH